MQPESREAYAKLIKQGGTDVVREHYPRERVYTFWHYWRNSWQRNAGLRIDHLLLGPELSGRVKKAGVVDRAIRGKPGASDHAPVWVELQTESSRLAEKAFDAQGDVVSSNAVRREWNKKVRGTFDSYGPLPHAS